MPAAWRMRHHITMAVTFPFQASMQLALMTECSLSLLNKTPLPQWNQIAAEVHIMVNTKCS